MNNAQLQEAIDKTRVWLTSSDFPSFKARDDAVAHLSELQKIQATRAAMASQPKLIKSCP